MRDHEAKLDWARRNTDALHDALRVFNECKPYEGTLEFNPQQGHYLTRLHITQQVPDWGLMAGDIVHNLRSALDCLAYGLARGNLGRPPDEREAKRTQFVLLDDLADWAEQSRRYLSHLSASASAVIDALQPYHGWHGGHRHPLSVLRDLANVDKHRHIPVTTTAVVTSNIEVVKDKAYVAAWHAANPGKPGGVSGQGVRGAFEEGAIFLITKLIGYENPKMHVDLELSLDIQFGQGWPAEGRRVIQFLRETHTHIRDVVFPALEKFL